jgi:hypothetical protein
VRLLVGIAIVLASAGAPAASAVAAPANDDFADAQAIGGLPASASGSNVGATPELEEPDHSPGYSGSGGFLGSSVWYSWQAPATTIVSISTCDSDYNTALAVYEGSTLAGLTEVESDFAGGEPDCGFYEKRAEVTFKAFAGTTYRILVDGWDGEWDDPAFEEAFGPVVHEGAIALKVAATPPPGNDDFAHAQPIDVGSSLARETLFGGNWGATKEAGEPDHAGVPGGASIWYSWTPSHGGAAHAIGCAGQIAIYTGDSVDRLAEIASEAGNGGACPQVWFQAVRGTTYRIALDNAYDAGRGYAPMRGMYLTLAIAPENDDFDDATALPSATRVDYSESSEEATKEPGEPDHAGNAGGRSVWFRWTAPETGEYILSTCGSSAFDSLLAVYVGESLYNLVQVASNDNGSGDRCQGTGSELTLAATGGVTYRLAVDGRDGEAGAFRLDLDKTRAQPLRQVEPQTRIRGRRINHARRRATFFFDARPGTAPVAGFTCRIDDRGPRPCSRRITYRHLDVGHHVFVVWATDVTGLADNRGPRIDFWIPKARHRRHANG